MDLSTYNLCLSPGFYNSVMFHFVHYDSSCTVYLLKKIPLPSVHFETIRSISIFKHYKCNRNISIECVVFRFKASITSEMSRGGIHSLQCIMHFCIRVFHGSHVVSLLNFHYSSVSSLTLYLPLYHILYWPQWRCKRSVTRLKFWLQDKININVLLNKRVKVEFVHLQTISRREHL